MSGIIGMPDAENPTARRSSGCTGWRPRCPVALPALGAAASLCLLSAGPRTEAASFQEVSGFVVMEAENFDLNFAQPSGAWVFDANALAADPFSGWGYMKAVGEGGTSGSFSPRLDFKVNFTTTGPHYIWVSGSDAGGDSLHVGLDGVVTSTSFNIGEAFGFTDYGELFWEGYNNTGFGYYDRPYLNVTTTGEHTVNVFIREPNLYVDRILLTTDINFEPAPLGGGANSGFNVPAQTLVPSPALAATITQPAPDKTFPSNTIVTVAAKAFTNGPAVSKVEFFANLLPSGTTNKIGEATALPYQIGWTNPTVGNYALRAVVSDTGSATATSAVVNVSITVPETCPSPLVWTTNSFTANLDRFTFTFSNHVELPGFPGYRIDLDWSNSTNAGGPAGEMGGNLARLANITPQVAEPLSRLLSFNDDLWFRASVCFSNGVGWNTDFFFGYFDTNSTGGTGSRVGFKILNPNPGWRFRAFAFTQSANLPVQIPDRQAGELEFHWIPSGLGDGSGTATGRVDSVGFTNSWPANSASFNAFGFMMPTQPTSTAESAGGWFDNVRYKVPGLIGLSAQRLGANQLVLSWAGDGYDLQYNDTSITNSSGWAVSPDPVVLIGQTYYSTNTISGGTRFFRLKLKCL